MMHLKRLALALALVLAWTAVASAETVTCKATRDVWLSAANKMETGCNMGAARTLKLKVWQEFAIVDFDAHHGNGIQEMFYHRADVLYISLHQSPLWPGTGTVDEVGAEDGFGRNLNLPMLPHAEDRHFARAFDEVVLPALALYEPDAILVSAGYDGHFLDPLPDLRLTADGFFEMTRKLTHAAAELCEGRILLALEGGYDLEIGLPESVEASARALMGLDAVEWTAPEETPHLQATDRVEETLEAVIALHTERWLS